MHVSLIAAIVPAVFIRTEPAAKRRSPWGTGDGGRQEGWMIVILGFPIVSVSIDFAISKTKIGDNQRAAAGGGKG